MMPGVKTAPRGSPVLGGTAPATIQTLMAFTYVENTRALVTASIGSTGKVTIIHSNYRFSRLEE